VGAGKHLRRLLTLGEVEFSEASGRARGKAEVKGILLQVVSRHRVGVLNLLIRVLGRKERGGEE
jgi:hypothetical protein